MNFLKREKRLPLLCLLSLSIIVSACGSGSVTLKDERPCAATGQLSNGGICTHTIGSSHDFLTLGEMLDFLEAQPARRCIPAVEGMNICADNQTVGTPIDLPARGPAIAVSSEDWAQKQIALDQACRLLGKKCTVQNQRAISGMKTILTPPRRH